MHEPVQIQGPQLCKLEASLATIQAFQEVTKSIVMSLTPLELSSWSEIEQSAQQVEKLPGKVSNVFHDFGH